MPRSISDFVRMPRLGARRRLFLPDYEDAQLLPSDDPRDIAADFGFPPGRMAPTPSALPEAAEPAPSPETFTPRELQELLAVLRQPEPETPRLIEGQGRGAFTQGGRLHRPSRLQRLLAPGLAALAQGTGAMGPQETERTLGEIFYGPYQRAAAQAEVAGRKRTRRLAELGQAVTFQTQQQVAQARLARETRLAKQKQEYVKTEWEDESGQRWEIRQDPWTGQELSRTKITKPEQTTTEEREFKREYALYLETKGLPKNAQNEMRFRREEWPAILKAKVADRSVTGYEDFRGSYPDTPAGRAQAARDWLTEERKTAARFRTDRPTEGEFKLHLFKTDPETYRTIYGTREKDEAATTREMIQYRGQLVQQLNQLGLEPETAAALRQELEQVDAELRSRIVRPPQAKPGTGAAPSNPYRKGKGR